MVFSTPQTIVVRRTSKQKVVWLVWTLSLVNHSIPQFRVSGTTIGSRGKCCTHGMSDVYPGKCSPETNRFLSSVIAVNLLSTDEILRAGRSSLKSDGQQ